MEEEKRTSGYAKTNDKDLLIVELSFKLGKCEEQIKEDEAVIEEMAKVMKSGGIVFYGGRSHKHIIEYFRNKVKGEKE